jgi:hypothetical protein
MWCQYDSLAFLDTSLLAIFFSFLNFKIIYMCVSSEII